MSNSIIHLNIYSNNAYLLLRQVLKNLNAPMYRISGAQLVQQPNAECVFSTKTDYYSTRIFTTHYSEHDAKIWFARTMKADVKRYIENNFDGEASEWRRDNLTKLSEWAEGDFTPTVQDMYFIYDWLIERKKLELKYSKSYIDSMIGTERNDIETALETEHRAQLDKIHAEWRSIINDADPNKYGKVYDDISTQVREFRRKLTEEYTKKLVELKLQYQAAIKECNDQYNLIVSGQAEFLEL